jgi:glycosyltransferase involved in cell wall biosynthesis
VSLSPLWLVDWSDSEDSDFRWAWSQAHIQPRVVRTRPLGPTVGRRRHVLRSYPAYASLAIRGLRRARGGTIVAWQPLAGAVTGFLRRRSRPPLMVLGAQILFSSDPGRRQRMAIAGLARADRLVFFTHHGMDLATSFGIPPERLLYTPLGVRARRDRPRPPGNYVLAAGRDSRDWKTLGEAARGLETEVVVTGPASLPDVGPLRLAPQVSGEPFFELLEGASALVLPVDADHPIGHLSMLAAMSVGRPIVVTDHPGVEDYVTPDTGIVVPAKNPAALRDALRRISDAEVARPMGESALEAARTSYSLERFVEFIDNEARALSG